MQFKRIVTYYLLCNAFILFLPTNSFAVGQEGHGGDIAVSVFLGIARTTCECFELNKNTWNTYPLLLDEMTSMIKKTKIYSVDKTLLEGQEVDAINYPDLENPKILINRNRWLDDNLNNHLRAELILHEYLSLIGYDDTQYQISYPIIQKNINCIENKN